MEHSSSLRLIPAVFTPIPADVDELKAVAVPEFGQYLYAWTDRGYMVVYLARKRKPQRIHPPKSALQYYFNAAAGQFTRPDSGPMYGRCGPDDALYTPDVLTTHPAGLTAAVGGGKAVVTDAHGREVFAVPGLPANPEWAIAAFSGCGSYFVVAAPGFLNIFRYDAGPVTAAAAAGGAAADRDGLFAAMCESPDDDTPRLIYADWLEEHNDPARAEFIRVQCRTAYGRGTPEDLARERELIGANGARWEAELPKVRGVYWDGWCRGFPGVSAFSMLTLQRSWKIIRKNGPVERVNGLYFTPADVARPKLDFLTDVRFLEVSLETVEAFRALLARQELKSLRAIRPRGAATGHVRAAARAKLPDLEFLDLSDLYRPTDADIGAVVAAKHLPALRRVALPAQDVYRCDLSAETRAAVAARFPG